jgi:hypothetical protein
MIVIAAPGLALAIIQSFKETAEYLSYLLISFHPICSLPFSEKLPWI